MSFKVSSLNLRRKATVTNYQTTDSRRFFVLPEFFTVRDPSLLLQPKPG
jgi:hypothetical protein